MEIKAKYHSIRGNRSKLLVISCFISCVLTGVDSSGQELTASALRGSLEQISRNLDSCHIVAANRGNQVSLQDVRSKNPPITFIDIRLSGENAQFYIVPGSTKSGNASIEWWQEKSFQPLKGQLTTENVGNSPGLKVCIQPSGKYVWAEARDENPESAQPYKVLYTRSESMRNTQVFYLPLVHLNRSWALPQRGAWFAVNSLLEIPVETWKVVGPTMLDQSRTILVEVPRQESLNVKLRSHEGTLEITPIWKVWFSAESDRGYFPLRIENSARYGYGGKQYDYERTQKSAPSSIVFEAHNIINYGPGIWYPEFGKEEFYCGDLKNPNPFNADKIVDGILSAGKFIDKEEYILTTSREWRVFSINTIDPNTNLWFDPPNEACVLDANTNSRFIVGLSPDESLRRLNLDDSRNNPALQIEPVNRSSWRWLKWTFITVNTIIFSLLFVRYISRRKKNV